MFDDLPKPENNTELQEFIADVLNGFEKEIEYMRAIKKQFEELAAINERGKDLCKIKLQSLPDNDSSHYSNTLILYKELYSKYIADWEEQYSKMHQRLMNLEMAVKVLKGVKDFRDAKNNLTPPPIGGFGGLN